MAQSLIIKNHSIRERQYPQIDVCIFSTSWHAVCVCDTNALIVKHQNISKTMWGWETLGTIENNCPELVSAVIKKFWSQTIRWYWVCELITILNSVGSVRWMSIEFYSCRQKWQLCDFLFNHKDPSTHFNKLFEM